MQDFVEKLSCINYKQCSEMNQRQLRLRALVQALPKKDYPNKIYTLDILSAAPQIESEYSFEGNWWYFWFRGEVPIEIGDNIFFRPELFS